MCCILETPELLYEVLFHLSYPDIRQIGSVNRRIRWLCMQHEMLRKLTDRRRIQYKTSVFLRRKGRDVFKSFLVTAILYSDVEVVGELLDLGHDPTELDGMAIEKASASGKLDMVNRLLEDKRVHPTDNCLMWACIGGHVGVVKRLLEDGRVDPTLNDNYLYRISVTNYRFEVVKALKADERVRKALS